MPSFPGGEVRGIAVGDIHQLLGSPGSGDVFEEQTHKIAILRIVKNSTAHIGEFAQRGRTVLQTIDVIADGIVQTLHARIDELENVGTREGLSDTAHPKVRQNE